MGKKRTLEFDTMTQAFLLLEVKIGTVGHVYEVEID